MASPPPNIDPYTPPKSTVEDYNHYLEENGYVYKNELVANELFKSPPICVKLGF